MARRNRVKRKKAIIPADLEEWMGLAAAAAARALPRFTVHDKDKTFGEYLKRCTPGNVYSLILAHVRALENIQALQHHLLELGCICPPGTDGHHQVCPHALAGHPAFQAFDATAPKRVGTGATTPT